MKNAEKQFTVAISAALMDAGEATRALEIARGIRDYAPEECRLKAVFLSHGGRFEQKILNGGFEIDRAEPQLGGVGFYHDLKPDRNNFIGSVELAAQMINGERAALCRIRPDAVLYGFWPFANLARRLVRPEIPGICYLPIPLERNCFGSLMEDAPDQIVPLTFLPVGARRAVMKAIPRSLKAKAPIFRQQNILDAAKQCGWDRGELRDLFDLMRPDLMIVNDLPDFYRKISLPPAVRVTGPLYSQPDRDEQVSPEIRDAFGDPGKVRIFCTMGSSGRKEPLLEAVRAIASLPPDRCRAVILAPKAVCSLEEAQKVSDGAPNLYLTDRFVPAKLVNAMADLVICHGGQGTVQTALASGTPIVGTAMQPEQQINLDHAVSSGAAVRIPITRWNRKNIRAAAERIIRDPSFQENAQKLARSMAGINGKEKCAGEIWNFLKRHREG